MSGVNLTLNLQPAHISELRRQCHALKISPSEFASQCVSSTLAERLLSPLPPNSASTENTFDIEEK